MLSATLASRLGLGPDEARRALLLGLVLFALTGSFTLAKTSRDALCLASFPADLLPYVYLGVGGLTMGGSLAIARLTRRWSVGRSLAGGGTCTAVSLLAFAVLFRMSTRVAPVTFYLWVSIYSLSGTRTVDRDFVKDGFALDWRARRRRGFRKGKAF